jgi:hypothetical protein
MHTTATVHVHPACASDPKLIQQLQSATDCLVILHNKKPKLVTKKYQLAPFDPDDGGRAA